ncbi:hypothetical protein [Burkholderia sp. 22313]|uniref:hypothetical protein n=1 Tax=Burkholderia sp. 22313 TaxID=3453908 RepID=UPI003F86C0E2
MAKARSPNYPALSLRKSLEFAGKVYAKNHTHKAEPIVVAQAMGYSGLNGKSLSAISALKKFGLLEDVDKQLRIARSALTILVEPSTSAERAETLVEAAFLPDLFAELRAEYGDVAPSDELLRSYLLRRGFLLATVDLPIRAYRETLEMVAEVRELCRGDVGKTNLDSSMSDDLGTVGSTAVKPNIEVGDLVQWEVNGSPQFERPRSVRALRVLDGQNWVFVDGRESGLPLQEVILERKNVTDLGPERTSPPMMPDFGRSLQVGEGEREWLRGPLSKDVSYRLLVSGDMGAKEIGKLIKLLTAQKSVLEDSDDD